MSPSGYTEDALIEQPAIAIFAELGWETKNTYHEFDHGMGTLGRETKAEVILTDRLSSVLERLNPTASPEVIEQAIDELTRDRSRLSMVGANRDVYHLLKEGVRVKVTDANGEGETDEIVRIIDWENPSNNDFLLCSQFWVAGEMHTRRADLIGFVNGLPLVFIELKAAHVQIKTSFTGNLSDYKDTVPQLFWPNALIILSNGSKSVIGSVTGGWEHFAEWKRISSEQEPAGISLETMIRGTCEPSRLLDIVENFTVFQDVRGGTIKLTTKNHQYLGVNNALAALTDIRRRDGKLGVFWHTQGSGKSISMLYFAQKVLRKLKGNWTFVIVTDRQELDGQIYDNFNSAGAITEGHAQAESSQHLRQLLGEDHRYVFTLIHKFRTEQGEIHPVLSERRDIIVITDEAHRSQYDTLALNMRTALPNAGFLAFTGTPLIVGEEKTKNVFGDYVSVYDFRQSVEDGATVPLYYENRIPELQIINDDLNRDMEALLDAAELDEAQEKELEREFSREYHLITRDDRLEAVARDIVSHFTGRGFQGKGMVICIDKVTAVRMYDKVKKHWAEMLDHLQKDRLKAMGAAGEALDAQIAFMQTIDIAVVVSQGQNEIAEMKEKGLDIKPHRMRMIEEDMEKKFKDPADPFRLVFVCAMWMTGFDVPSCSTLYLDKPMRNHTLMQTIARANRVYEGKVSGLIVDYAGVFRSLEKALAIYGGGMAGGGRPVEDKKVLIKALRKAVNETYTFSKVNCADLTPIPKAQGFKRVALLDKAVDALVATEDIKRRYLDLASTVNRLYRAILPDEKAKVFSVEVWLIKFIADKIRSLVETADIDDIMTDVEDLLDRSIATEGYIIHAPLGKYGVKHLIDLSEIDFEKLAEKFAQGRQRTINEKLKHIIARALNNLVEANRTRVDYLEKFQQMIDEYNAGTTNAEEFFKRLSAFAKELTAEERRGVAEQLSEEELAIFDLLTKPDIELSEADRNKVKATSRKLLQTLKETKLGLDWRKQQQGRAAVRVTIENMLDAGLPTAYTPELYQQKSMAVYEHVCDAYYGAGRSVYMTISR
jgi:type I restriction enzyme, R subunit